ncbi:hypothetical protein TNCV_879861 [Trichonephila clavipes]|nr:hypothetical protein TNCV_879861 [Trichonephila clavipes]
MPHISFNILLLLSCLSRREGMKVAGAWLDFCTIDGETHHLSPPPQFRYGTGEERNILQPSAPVVSAAIAHKNFRPY